jgi:hypothetical protein
MTDSAGSGPVMLAATHFLKKPPQRVGGIGKRIRWGRSVEARYIVAGALGALGGVVFPGVILGILFGGVGALLGAGIGGTVAILSVNYTPSKGESVFSWAQLAIRSRSGRVALSEGSRERVFIGLCRLPRVAQGRVQLVRSAVDVEPDWVDADRLRARR